jgi:phage gpG-like protein
MENNNAPMFKHMFQRYNDLVKQAPKMVGVIALALFLESFSKKGQIMGGGVKAWDAMGGHPKNRSSSSLLIKSGQLRRSLNFKTSGSRVTIYTNEVYAKLQNDGGVIPVTSKMRKFFWAMYKESKDEFWKGMALTHKTEFTIKPRPFLYDTPELANRLDQKFIPLIKDILTNS